MSRGVANERNYKEKKHRVTEVKNQSVGSIYITNNITSKVWILDPKTSKVKEGSKIHTLEVML